MALHGTIQMNGEVLGVWAAVAQAEGYTRDDAPNTYDVEVIIREMGVGGADRKIRSTVSHVYTDGALTLAAKVLAEVDRVRKVDSL